MWVQSFCIPPVLKLDFLCKNRKSSNMKRVGGLNRDCCRVLTTKSLTMSCAFIVVTQQAPVPSSRPGQKHTPRRVPRTVPGAL